MFFIDLLGGLQGVTGMQMQLPLLLLGPKEVALSIFFAALGRELLFPHLGPVALLPFQLVAFPEFPDYHHFEAGVSQLVVSCQMETV
jgi:hypothetical protein